jgi:hypothetical protein
MLDDSKKKFLKGLLEASESVLRQDHPNPNRLGCPSASVIEQLASFSEENVPVDAEVIRHVTECYPCFRQLRELRLSRRREK